VCQEAHLHQRCRRDRKRSPLQLLMYVYISSLTMLLPAHRRARGVVPLLCARRGGGRWRGSERALLSRQRKGHLHHPRANKGVHTPSILACPRPCLRSHAPAHRCASCLRPARRACKPPLDRLSPPPPAPTPPPSRTPPARSCLECVPDRVARWQGRVPTRRH
jgi:hypothetical protein